MQQDLALEKKKLLYRSLNRGCKETDLLLAKFAKNYLAELNSAEIVLYERFLEEYDGDIYNWLCGKLPLPAEYQPIATRLAAACKV